MKALRIAAVAVAVVLIAVALGRWISSGGTATRRDPRQLPITTTNVAWSPDGLRIAAVSAGTVRVFRVADGVEELTTGRSIVAVAWMPDAKRLLVAEGPIPTGEVATIDLSGKVTGVAHLSPSIDFDNGYGLTVNSDGTQAVAVDVTQSPLGDEQHFDLATIALGTGAVAITRTPDLDERRPVYSDDGTVAFLAGDYLFARSLADGTSRRLGEAQSIVGVAPDGRVGVRAGCCSFTLFAPATGKGVVQALEFPAGEPTAADPLLRRYLVLQENGSRIEGITE